MSIVLVNRDLIGSSISEYQVLFKNGARTHFIRKYNNYLGNAIKLVLYILKQLFAEVEVNSGGYLPHRNGSVNIHRSSPPLRRIIVNY